jgi:hypothetical protein
VIPSLKFSATAVKMETTIEQVTALALPTAQSVAATESPPALDSANPAAAAAENKEDKDDVGNALVGSPLHSPAKAKAAQSPLSISDLHKSLWACPAAQTPVPVSLPVPWCVVVWSKTLHAKWRPRGTRPR